MIRKSKALKKNLQDETFYEQRIESSKALPRPFGWHSEFVIHLLGILVISYSEIIKTVA